MDMKSLSTSSLSLPSQPLGTVKLDRHPTCRSVLWRRGSGAPGGPEGCYDTWPQKDAREADAGKVASPPSQAGTEENTARKESGVRCL
ncbi:hypothetical protein E2C01_058328 [Portunus trituberculatus]|uniref:Uncharacterized protein n=1 Tax=Portunus trituberculatus TaxID=210409 RepID=A0A5B7H4E9_PORTR|nr:hypothetical protein [Portunus trituberculatus]